MRKIISSILEISVDDISIKATTTEQMGFVGRGEGIVAYASALVES
jgi:2-C-methyl-D-erythritol 2,4-cyclodiphosphate synthase